MPLGESSPLSNNHGWGFRAALWLLAGAYLLLVGLMLGADLLFASPASHWKMLTSPAILQSLRLSLITCTVSTVLALLLGIPLGYLLARSRFWGRGVVDLLVDLPQTMPPLVLGVSLLILFHLPIGGTTLQKVCEQTFGQGVAYTAVGIVVAQMALTTSLVARYLRGHFETKGSRAEQVALTLGCSPWQAFWRVTLREARPAILVAGTLAWSRALGEFGPILMFAGATRGRTEVLSTSIFLEMSIGNHEGALTIALLLIALAMCTSGLVRFWSSHSLAGSR